MPQQEFALSPKSNEELLKDFPEESDMVQFGFSKDHSALLIANQKIRETSWDAFEVNQTRKLVAPLSFVIRRVGEMGILRDYLRDKQRH